MQDVLLLNGSWEVLRVVPLTRALCLIFAGKAEIVDSSDAVVCSPTASFVVPNVIRLRYVVRVPYRARLPLSRAAVLKRDSGKCGYCDKPAKTVDHILPRSRGGKNIWENVVAACTRCNAKKANHLLSELGWKLKCTPVAPSGTRWMLIGLANPAWDRYLPSPV